MVKYINSREPGEFGDGVTVPTEFDDGNSLVLRQAGDMGHTPGPWWLPHFARADVNCQCGYVLSEHQGGMGAIATVHCSGDGNDWQAHGDNPKFAEAVANARLIAAAPDLLDALRMADETFRDLGWHDKYEVTSAAISLATGAK